MEPEMSSKTKELLGRARQLVPPLLDKFHKGSSGYTLRCLVDSGFCALTSSLLTFATNTGQQGRIGVIGGSIDYTGAPYFSAMASARLGCDMVRESSSSDPVVWSHNAVSTVYSL